MTWSVNWDKTTNGGTAVNEFVSNYSDYFSKLPSGN
jgi:chitinase